MTSRVVAVDIGSVGPPSKFAWAGFDAPGREVVAVGDNPGTAVSALLSGLTEAGRAVLLLESPVSVPVPQGGPDSWRLLGRARAGEGNRPWSAGAGAAVLATGLAQGAWMLRSLAVAAHGLAATTQPAHWRRGAAQLLLAEAFVSAAGKPVPLSGGQHAADAAAAGLAMVEFLDSPDSPGSDVRCSPQESFSLLAAMALWAGLRIDPGELHQEVLVIAARPDSDPRPGLL